MIYNIFMKKEFIEKLKEKYWIRLHMSLILMVTVISAIGFSKLTYFLGWHDLTTRYLCGFLFSYAIFMGMIRMWLWYIFKKAPENNTDLSDADFLDLWITSPQSITKQGYSGGGGGFSGGGASESWGDVKESSSLDSIGDVDEAAPILLVIALALFIFAILFGGVYIVIEAPVFLGEIAFEVALGFGIIKSKELKLKPVSWLEKSWKKTMAPVIIISILIIVLGLVIKSYDSKITNSKELIYWITQIE